MKEQHSPIPVIRDCVIALHQDFEQGTERIVIGERDNVRLFLYGQAAPVLFSAERPLRSFILDCFNPMAGKMADLRVALCDALAKKKAPIPGAAADFLLSLYKSDNLALKFLSVRIWNDFHQRKSNFIDRIEDLTLPFRYNVENEITVWQSEHPRSPLLHFDYEFYKHPPGLLFERGKRGVAEYAVCGESLMPLLLYALKGLYDHHLYFQRCKVCGELLLARTANIQTLCSEECRRKMKSFSKQRYDERTKGERYEQEHKNNYDYWYNRLRKLRAAPDERLLRAEAAFELFRAEAIERKKAVKQGELPEKEFCDWLFKQSRIIDEIVDGKA